MGQHRAGTEAIDIQLPKLEHLISPVNCPAVMTVQIGSQAGLCIVGLLQHILKVCIRPYRHYRAENLLSRDPHILGDIGHQSGAEVGPFLKPGGDVTSIEHFGPMRLRVLDEAQHPVPLPLVDEGAHDRLSGVPARSHPHLFQQLHRLVAELLIPALMDVDAVIADAGLAAVGYLAGHCQPHRRIHVPVLHDNTGGVAAQLQGVGLHRGGPLGHHLPPGLCRADEGDHLGDRAGVQCLAQLPGGAGDDVHHAGGQANLMHDLPQIEGGQRSLAGGLQHAAAARGDGGADLQRRVAQGVVPGQVAHHHSQGAPVDQVVELSPAGAVIGKGGAGNPADLLRKESQARDTPVEVVAGFGVGLARLLGEQVHNVLFLLQKGLGILAQPAHPLVQGGPGPSLEGLLRRLEGLLRLGGGGSLDGGHGLSVGRVFHPDGRPLPVHQLTVDILFEHFASLLFSRGFRQTALQCTSGPPRHHSHTYDTAPGSRRSPDRPVGSRTA